MNNLDKQYTTLLQDILDNGSTKSDNYFVDTLQMSKEQAKTELIKLLMNQVADLTMMSKIELGDDVITEINRLKSILK